jgi:hypothetical protein
VIAKIPRGARGEIEREMGAFLADLYPLYAAAVERIESNPAMRLPLLRMLVIGDVSTREGLSRLATEIGDMLAHSRCFWLRPLDERERGFYGERTNEAYHGRLFRVASELNAIVIESD